METIGLKLIKLIEYKNGSIYWKVSPGNWIQIGQIVGSPNIEGYWCVKFENKQYYNHDGYSNLREENPQKIICAAIRNIQTNHVICGIRHFDLIMAKQITNPLSHHSDWEQGFLDQFSDFFTREQSYIIAVAANQIQEKTDKKLYSEDLY